jgi:hypothetical protein
MAVISGSPIEAIDYNSIRQKVISLLGAGTAQRGYGQAIVSSSVTAGNQITKAQWDALRIDILNIFLHQTGQYPPIVTLAPLAVIDAGAGHPATNYNTLTDTAVLGKFNIGPGQSTLLVPTITGQTSPGTISRTGSWSSQSRCTLTVTFSNANDARYFFNTGGKIRFSSSRTGGAGTQQNGSWTNLLNTTVGTFSFGADTPEIINYYSLTTSYQQVYSASASSSYANNSYRIEALCNCSESTNQNGTATTITFRFTWQDNYTDPGPTIAPPDLVDGTLSLTTNELKAQGVMLPSGTFTVTSPTYSISSITAT